MKKQPRKHKKKRLKRTCIVCGKTINLTLYGDGRYSSGHYYGELKLPIEGTGEYKKTGATRFGKRKFDVVKWTGKEKKVEHWECNSCFNEAMHELWLEEKIEKLFGERCKDFEPDCHVCRAWEFYDGIRKFSNESEASEKQAKEKPRKKKRKKQVN